MSAVFKFIFLLYLVPCVTSSPISEKHDKEIVSIQLIRHHDDHRIRREAGESGMPDVIVNKFTMSGDDVIFRLRRVPCPQVYLVGDALEEYSHVPMDSAVYVDPTRRAAFMVSRSDNGDFLLDGHFRHQGRQLSLSPHRSTRSTDGSDHIVTTFESTVILFGSDGVNENANSSTNGTEQTNSTVNATEAFASRSKRAITLHTVETIFVMDYKEYSNWLARFPTGPMTKLVEYYVYIEQSMNIIYESVAEINNALNIKIRVILLYILKTSTESYSETLYRNSRGMPIDGTAFLNAFSQWITLQGTRLRSADHYMTFTGYDIAVAGGEAVGIANVAAVCRGARSVSVVENSFQASVANIAAHELGHSLGAPHDGSNGCSAWLQKVMSPSFYVPPNVNYASPGNLFDFSYCSVVSFTNYLSRQTCTLPAQTTYPSVLPSISKGMLVKDRDYQCRVATNDVNSYYCKFRLEAELCYGMLCRIPSRGPTTTCSYVLPFEETPCGIGKVCRQGVCVAAQSSG